MWPLTDITVYYENESDSYGEFRRMANFVCDIYHNRLNGYKPPKTARICLHLRSKRVFEMPCYFGAICSYDIEFDFGDFVAIDTRLNRYKFILDLVHNAILEIAEILNWDKSFFISAYRAVLADNFVFIKEYPIKRSRDRRTVGQVTLEKTETSTALKLRINNGQIFEILLLKKKNWFWLDSAYQLADKMKWIDKDSFGYKSMTSGKALFYSLKENRIVKNFEIKDEDF